ncbi:unnamed protein product [marine sediment metagenome]|uniref:Uncharacterized protein n=1 Tax=marine sediment metagenome TaxID=412755 RepID=X1CSG9_9ZZZZ
MKTSTQMQKAIDESHGIFVILTMPGETIANAADNISLIEIAEGLAMFRESHPKFYDVEAAVARMLETPEAITSPGERQQNQQEATS